MQTSACAQCLRALRAARATPSPTLIEGHARSRPFTWTAAPTLSTWSRRPHMQGPGEMARESAAMRRRRAFTTSAGAQQGHQAGTEAREALLSLGSNNVHSAASSSMVSSDRKDSDARNPLRAPPHPHNKRNTLLILAAAAVSKLFCALGCSEFRVDGLENLLAVIHDVKRREEGRGVVTYCNHISVMDEPLIWASLPISNFLSAETTRWTLGAQDVMFDSTFTSWFFGKGQVIATHRGGGIFQGAVDRSIDKLRDGQWVHIFPEGYVNMSRKMTLRRFKWGVSRMVLEAAGLEDGTTGTEKASGSKPPIIIPIWISGFDAIMPEPRGWPHVLPRLGAKVSVFIGEPIDLAEYQPYLDAYAQENRRLQDKLPDSTNSMLLQLPEVAPSPPHTMFPPSTPLKPPPGGWPVLPEGSRAAIAQAADTPRKQEIRSGLAGLLRMKLAELGIRARAARGEEPGEGSLVHTLMQVQEEEQKAQAEAEPALVKP